MSISRTASCGQPRIAISLPVVVFAFVFVALTAGAFAPSRKPFTKAHRSSTSLNGVSEWRDIMFDLPISGEKEQLGANNDQGPPRELCILPFPYQEVLLQGETKELRLYEDRFIKLFDYCMEHHCGVVGMGLLAESGVIQTVPLCEVEDYNRMDNLGIFVTIRVVGRASLLDLTQQEPYLKAVCVEITDKASPDLELSSMLAGNIETFLYMLSSLEYRLLEAAEADPSIAECLEDDLRLKKKIVKARTKKRIKAKLKEIRGQGEESERKRQDEEQELDRSGEFAEAFHVALATDTQGYMIQQPTEEVDPHHRSARDLTAISWAAFCTGDREQDATFRIQALDSNDLVERLKLASYMLREKKSELLDKTKKAGLTRKGEDGGVNAGDESR